MVWQLIEMLSKLKLSNLSTLPLQTELFQICTSVIVMVLENTIDENFNPIIQNFR